MAEGQLSAGIRTEHIFHISFDIAQLSIAGKAESLRQANSRQKRESERERSDRLTSTRK